MDYYTTRTPYYMHCPYYDIKISFFISITLKILLITSALFLLFSIVLGIYYLMVNTATGNAKENYFMRNIKYLIGFSFLVILLTLLLFLYGKSLCY